MKFIVFVILCVVSIQATENRPKSVKDSSLTSEESKEAIIAIRIVDPEEEKHTGKNYKRTIESSLGYGFRKNHHGNQQSAPRYEIYKYSQHDIPPYSGTPSNLNHVTDVGRHQNGYQNNIHGSANSYKPGTTLFSTINQNGHISALSQNVPNNVEHHGQAPIPVIILRVLPSQLASPTYPLYPKLPLTNNFAPLINSIDIRTLLSKYLSQQPNLKPKPKYETKPIYEPQQTYLPQPSFEPQPNYQPQQPSYQPHQSYQPQTSFQPQPTYQPQREANYQPQPNYQSQQNYQPHQDYQPTYNHIPETNVREEYQSSQQFQSAPRQEEPSRDSSYEQVKSHVLSEETVYEPSKQYIPEHFGSHKDLLTHENYPSLQHTRIIFRTPEGQIRNNQLTHYDVQQAVVPNEGQIQYTHSSPLQQEQHQVDYQYVSSQDYSEQVTESNQFVYDDSASEEKQKIVYVPSRRRHTQQS